MNGVWSEDKYREDEYKRGYRAGVEAMRDAVLKYEWGLAITKVTREEADKLFKENNGDTSYSK